LDETSVRPVPASETVGAVEPGTKLAPVMVIWLFAELTATLEIVGGLAPQANPSRQDAGMSLHNARTSGCASFDVGTICDISF
jgi:hypothetical protein